MKAWFAALLATAGTKWGNFCENNLIANDPTMVILQQGLKASPEHEAWLIDMYRYYGAKAYYGDWAAGRELKYYGDEMRAYGIGQEAIEDYGRFER